MTKMEDEIFLPKNLILFEIKLPLLYYPLLFWLDKADGHFSIRVYQIVLEPYSKIRNAFLKVYYFGGSVHIDLKENEGKI